MLLSTKMCVITCCFWHDCKTFRPIVISAHAISAHAFSAHWHFGPLSFRPIGNSAHGHFGPLSFRPTVKNHFGPLSFRPTVISAHVISALAISAYDVFWPGHFGPPNFECCHFGPSNFWYCQFGPCLFGPFYFVTFFSAQSLILHKRFIYYFGEICWHELPDKTLKMYSKPTCTVNQHTLYNPAIRIKEN